MASLDVPWWDEPLPDGSIPDLPVTLPAFENTLRQLRMDAQLPFTMAVGVENFRDRRRAAKAPPLPTTEFPFPPVCGSAHPPYPTYASPPQAARRYHGVRP